VQNDAFLRANDSVVAVFNPFFRTPY